LEQKCFRKRTTAENLFSDTNCSCAKLLQQNSSEAMKVLTAVAGCKNLFLSRNNKKKTCLYFYIQLRVVIRILDLRE
jgi:hypothetical protein